ncbi:prolipoprotein diacylglyceryl transferase family protein [Salinisphaera orenii]|uniref:prolipoprotein diacylglyceryl transferase family protein n=1 Tax=Salinisphaera orenii TaxID=856731 RepID=UPI000DBE4749
MLSFGLGPFVISVSQALMGVALVVALGVGQFAARQRGAPITDTLFTLVVVGIVTARVVFVARYFPSYGLDPLAWIDIRDGGFEVVAGVLGMAFYASLAVWRRPSLRRPLAAAALAGGLTWGLTGGTLALIAQQSRTLPSASLQTLGGTATDLPQLHKQADGRPMVVNIWASWCPPCQHEMPMLGRAQDQDDDVMFVFVNKGESTATIRGFLDQNQLDLEHVVRDPRGELSRRIGSAGLPTTLFYNARGRLVDTHLGALSRATLVQALERFDPDPADKSNPTAREST